VLANDLKSVFHGLEASGTVHVVINHWVKLSLTLTNAMSLKMQDFRPYQTLLLLTDEDAVLNALPADHSYQLSVLIKAASPLKTFQDLALETSIPILQLFRLAAHLVYWGFGRVVDTITMHNFYQVRPKRSLRSTSALALEFKRTFPPRELCEVLASFNGARRLGDSVKNLGSAQKMEYIHMLVRGSAVRSGIFNRFILTLCPLSVDLAAAA
jgi:nitrogen permease regulator 3-like protein